jgi:predicted DNA-binding transcriptional regulator AlpA
MGPLVKSKTQLPKIPSDAEDVALVDAQVSAAIGGMKMGWWYGKVREGEAPQPVIRAPRCTRWRLSDVREFWRKFAEQGANDTSTAALVQSRVEKASARARQLRVVAKATPTSAQ